jgi:hypothetical protein
VRSPRNSSSSRAASEVASSSFSDGQQAELNVCAVRCFRELLQRLRPDRIPLREPATPQGKLSVREDCLWWSLDPATEDPVAPRSLQEILLLAQDFIDEARLLQPTKKWVLGEPAQPSVLGNGVKICVLGNTIASGYNKIDALNWFLAERRLTDRVRRVVFVDDNVDNVMSVFQHFADLEWQWVRASLARLQFCCPWGREAHRSRHACVWMGRRWWLQVQGGRVGPKPIEVHSFWFEPAYCEAMDSMNLQLLVSLRIALR